MFGHIDLQTGAWTPTRKYAKNEIMGIKLYPIGCVYVFCICAGGTHLYVSHTELCEYLILDTLFDECSQVSVGELVQCIRGTPF